MNFINFALEEGETPFAGSATPTYNKIWNLQMNKHETFNWLLAIICLGNPRSTPPDGGDLLLKLPKRGD